MIAEGIVVGRGGTMPSASDLFWRVLLCPMMLVAYASGRFVDGLIDAAEWWIRKLEGDDAERA